LGFSYSFAWVLRCFEAKRGTKKIAPLDAGKKVLLRRCFLLFFYAKEFIIGALFVCAIFAHNLSTLAGFATLILKFG